MLLNVHLDVNISVLHYICYKLTPPENHFKGQGPGNFIMGVILIPSVSNEFKFL